jgi:dihydrofolate reductase
MLSIVVAAAENDAIGLRNTLPWHVPEDLRNFRRITTGHAVIVGRRTHQSIMDRLGRPLPDRHTIVLSSAAALPGGLALPDAAALPGTAALPGGVAVARTLDEALRLAEEFRSRESQDEVFVIGGSSLYTQSLPLVRKVYLTRVHRHVEGDAYLSPGWLDGFSLDMRGDTLTSRTGIRYTFQSYSR